jgi:hypothetical protein
MMKKILVFGLFFFLFFSIPEVKAEIAWNNSIEQDFVFDGVNYRMITKYGDYVWLQPNNIMEYWDLDGNEVIDKSVWILQHNTTGVWLPLIDFDNQQIDLVNETFYEISYDVKYKHKGPSRIVGHVEIGFYSSGQSRNRPKIQVNFTKGSDWVDLGMESFRWLWDLVPTQKYLKIIKGNNIIDITTSTLEIVDSHIMFGSGSDNSNAYVIDSTAFLYDPFLIPDPLNRSEGSGYIWNSTRKSYQGINITGGSEPYWNSKGIIFIYPDNEGFIDPYTVTALSQGYATAYEMQNKRVFKNPGGLGWYYVFYFNESAPGLGDYGVGQVHGMKSENGSVWSELATGIPYGNTFAVTENVERFFDFCYYRNIHDNMTIVHGIWSYYRGAGPGSETGFAFNRGEIWDNETDFRAGIWSWFLPLDDGSWNVWVDIDYNGIVWMGITDEFTVKGQQRGTPYIFWTPFPWEDRDVGAICDLEPLYKGSEITKNPDFMGWTDAVIINRSFADPDYEMIIATVFSVDSEVTGNYLLNVTEWGYNTSYLIENGNLPYGPGDFPYRGSDDVDFAPYTYSGCEEIEADLDQTQNPPIFSAQTQENRSDIYVLHTPNSGSELQIDIAHPVSNTTTDNWADIYSGGGVSNSYQLTFDWHFDPDEIMVIWLNRSGTEEHIILLSSLNISNPVPNIFDNFTETTATDLDYLSASNYADESNNYQIYIVATNGTENVRYFNISLPFIPPVVDGEPPDWILILLISTIPIVFMVIKKDE